MATATLEIFLAYGDPKRLRTAELSNWIGKAVSGPRSEFDKVLAREESLSSGVYFLTGVDPKTNKSAIYIGEEECIRDRIKSHLSKDFWNNITFFISKDDNLTKAHIKYIEDRLIDVARSVERSVVINSQGSGAKLPESDREEMEVFLEKIQQILPVLGVEVFVQTHSITEEKQEELLSCNIKELKAEGYLTPNGIVVLKGSQAVLEERGSAKKWPSVLVQRNKLIEEGTLINDSGAYVFTKDVEFSSPSSAAAIIYDGSANGLTAWVNSDGKQLKNLQNIQ